MFVCYSIRSHELALVVWNTVVFFPIRFVSTKSLANGKYAINKVSQSITRWTSEPDPML